MEAIQRGLDRVIDAAMIVAEVAITLMMLHITIEVVSRWLFLHSFDATNEIVAFYYMACLTYLSLAYVTRADGHIAAEIFTDRMGKRPREILEGVIALALGGYMLVFTWQTAGEALTMTRVGEIQQSATIYLLKWPTRWYLPIGGFLMALAALVIAVGKLAGKPPAKRPADLNITAQE